MSLVEHVRWGNNEANNSSFPIYS